MAPKLIILSTSFPFGAGAEGNFLGPEVAHHSRNFSEVRIIPSKVDSVDRSASLPPNCIVETELARRLAFGSLRILKALPIGIWCIRTPSAYASSQLFPSSGYLRSRLINCLNLGFARIIMEYLLEGISEGRFSVQETVFYSYWLKYTSLALAWLKQSENLACVVSRAHGSDLYAEHASFGVATGQPLVVSRLDRVYCISESGRTYLSRQYPEYSDRFACHRLGSPNPGLIVQPSAVGAIRVVSCSRIIPLKQVDRIYRVLAHVRAVSRKKVIWTHFGDGPDLNSIKRLTQSDTDPRFEINFAGQKQLSEIYAHYRDQPCDIFINASISEGIPVSIMEALSCGLPAIAPDVGGVSEIVSPQSGSILFGREATDQDIAESIIGMVNSKSEWHRRSELAHEFWKRNYEAESNYQQFSTELTSLLNETRIKHL